ncbi:hypothetical protein G7078_09555 [Sphingomonas sinipercae]|uniref:Uncharacterized protein n=1 Tax=Sphingomonas sinipercae TaxID=2714944 RepID=A0A6G7ZPY7_9SPHN|nr:DUF6766 family protein [Sphingomonas sinipercae]QIL02995.1 hypothetical protein G7078_09555 [Sphingomonas sinipercae]
MTVFRKYAYAWITVAFFLISLALHWLFGWYAFADSAREHGQAPDVSAYLVEMGRDTFENWQSEFLQLLWQVVGLAYFLYVGSPSSKENDDRIEAKVDALMRMVGGENAQEVIGKLDYHFARKDGVEPHKHGEAYVHSAGLDVPPRR